MIEEIIQNVDALRKVGKYELALGAINKGLDATAPDHSGDLSLLHYNAALICNRIGNKSGAKLRMQISLELDPANSRARVFLCDIHLQNAHTHPTAFHDAYNLLDETRTTRPETLKSTDDLHRIERAWIKLERHMGCHLESSDRFVEADKCSDEALAIAERICAANPADQRNQAELGVTRLLKSNFQEAEKAITAAGSEWNARRKSLHIYLQTDYTQAMQFIKSCCL